MRIVALVMALFGVPAVALAAEETFKIDPNHTFPNFTINHLGFSTMHGRFGKTSGTITMDKAKKTGTVVVVIDAASVDTGFGKRDDHLRSPDFLNAVEYPDITYKSTKVMLHDNGGATVDGMLTILGVSKPVTLKVNSINCGIHPMDPSKKKYVCGFDATAKIKRSDFGMNFALPAIGDEMDIALEVEAERVSSN